MVDKFENFPYHKNTVCLKKLRNRGQQRLEERKLWGTSTLISCGGGLVLPPK